MKAIYWKLFITTKIYKLKVYQLSSVFSSKRLHSLLMGEVSLTDTYDQHRTYSKETKLWKHSNQYYMLSYAKTRSDQHSLGTSLRIFSRNETRMKAAWVGLSLVYKGANFLIIPPPLIIRNTPRILLCRHCLLPVSLLQVTPPMILYSQVCHILKVKCYVRQGLLRKPSKSP